KDGQPDSSPGRKINVTLKLDPAQGPPAGLPPVYEPEIVLLSEGDADFDYAKTYANLQAQYDFLAEWLGRKPSQTVTVHVGPGYGGSSNGYHMWLDSFRIDGTTHNYAHEMMHCF